MRLFLAIDIPATIKDKIKTLYDETLFGAKWTRRNQWHITLHFMGDCEDDSAIRQSLQSLECEAFDLHLKGVGQFPKRGKPRVLWTGVTVPETLKQLHRITGERLKSIGYEPDTRPFNPHLTLARFNKDKPGRDSMRDYYDTHSDFETESFSITQCTLYESQLLPTGAVYTVREHFPLSE